MSDYDVCDAFFGLSVQPGETFSASNRSIENSTLVFGILMDHVLFPDEQRLARLDYLDFYIVEILLSNFVQRLGLDG